MPKVIVKKALTARLFSRLSLLAVQNGTRRRVGAIVDTNFLKAQAERCRALAENADQFTKRRLLDLAANYDKRLPAAGPAATTRTLKAPFELKDAPTPI